MRSHFPDGLDGEDGRVVLQATADRASSEQAVGQVAPAGR
jgi:hypothetical protein